MGVPTSVKITVGSFLIALVLWIIYQSYKAVVPAKASGFSRGQLHWLTVCPKCGCDGPRNICPVCLSCAQCRAEDKCGQCQRFGRQVDLLSRSCSCSLCGKKPCVCPGAGGQMIVREPGVARNGIYSDPVVLVHRFSSA
jgi:hypothetical protein